MCFAARSPCDGIVYDVLSNLCNRKVINKHLCCARNVRWREQQQSIKLTIVKRNPLAREYHWLPSTEAYSHRLVYSFGFLNKSKLLLVSKSDLKVFSSSSPPAGSQLPAALASEALARFGLISHLRALQHGIRNICYRTRVPF